jgi:hypothetical protein
MAGLRLNRFLAMCAAAGMTTALTGCVSEVPGTAYVAQDEAARDGEFHESDLRRIPASVATVNAIMNATMMREVASSERMNDSSDSVSYRDCLGAVLAAEELVYSGSDWTAVRDRVMQEPGAGNDHWVQQVVVLYPSAKKATNFVEGAKSLWQRCENAAVDVDSSNTVSTWDVGTPGLSGDIVTQMVGQRNSGGWSCQHALGSTANVVVEVWACGRGMVDQGHAIAAEMLKNAAG